MGLLRTIAGTVLTAAAGIVSLNLFILGATAQGAFFKPVPRKKREDRSLAQQELWDLSSQPWPGFQHRFHEVREGLHIHYVEGGDTSADSPLVIFIHGFPDSWFIWHHQLSSPTLQSKAHMIAIDLPGYGGSGHTERASASAILTAVADFIIAQKERKNHDNCVLVSHDWGSVVTFRLASEVGFLFSRCIILNAIHPSLAIENATRATDSSRKMFRTYIRNPTNFTLFRSAFKSLRPLLTQLKCSYYISVFLLPNFLAHMLPKMGDFWFLRLLGKLSKTSTEESYLASSLGPSLSEIDGYPDSVKARAVNKNTKFDAMIAYYRHNLAFGKWKKPDDIQLLAAASDAASGGFGMIERKKGSFMCPVTVVWGGKDNAFHRPFCFEGIDDYFFDGKIGNRKSYLLCFPKAGHWSQVSSPGRESLEMLIEAELEGLHGQELKDKVWQVDSGVKFETEK